MQRRSAVAAGGKRMCSCFVHGCARPHLLAEAHALARMLHHLGIAVRLAHPEALRLGGGARAGGVGSG